MSGFKARIFSLKYARRRNKMNSSELKNYKEILENDKSNLEAALRSHEGIEIEKNSDPIDAVQAAADREVTISEFDGKTNRLKNVRTALRRLNDGSFGTCMDCDEEISPKRLKAIPHAIRCISCQEAVDTKLRAGDDSLVLA